MRNQYKISFVLSGLVLGVIGLIWLSTVSVYQILFIIIPVAVGVISMLVKRNILDTIFYIVYFIAFLLFWFSKGIQDQMVIDGYSVVGPIYTLVMTGWAVYAPKSKPNWLFGLRTPVLIENPVLWHKVHSMFSCITTFFIMPQFLLTFYIGGGLRFLLNNLLLLVPIFLSLFYMSCVVKKGKKQNYTLD